MAIACARIPSLCFLLLMTHRTPVTEYKHSVTDNTKVSRKTKGRCASPSVSHPSMIALNHVIYRYGNRYITRRKPVLQEGNRYYKKEEHVFPPPRGKGKFSCDVPRVLLMVLLIWENGEHNMIVRAFPKRKIEQWIFRTSAHFKQNKISCDQGER